jgi:hypothetical protein
MAAALCVACDQRVITIDLVESKHVPVGFKNACTVLEARAAVCIARSEQWQAVCTRAYSSARCDRDACLVVVTFWSEG